MAAVSRRGGVRSGYSYGIEPRVMNTPEAFQILRGDTAKVKAYVGKVGEPVYDTQRKTLVMMDGTTAGGSAMALEARKIKAGTANVKINGGTEADLSSDITLVVNPGTVPTGIQVVTNPEGQAAGQYLEISYLDQTGAAQKYYVSLASLVTLATYTAGSGIKIDGNVISIDPDKFLTDLIATDGGLAKDATGKLYVDVEDLVDPNSSLEITDDGKLSVLLLSADAGNNLKLGSDGGLYFPADLGTL